VKLDLSQVELGQVYNGLSLCQDGRVELSSSYVRMIELKER